MSTSPPAKSSLPDPSYHWTTRKAQVFLAALGNFGHVGEAARMVGMSRQSAYALRDRLGEGSLFARMWERSLAKGREMRKERRSSGRNATVLPPEADIFGLGR